MFIRKTTTQTYSKTGKTYATYRLVHTYRNVMGKAKQETLLNLGSEFAIPECDWRLLCDRIEQLQDGKTTLFELPVKLEDEARRIVKILSKRNAEKSIALPIASSQEIVRMPNTDYQTVDINSVKEDEVRHIGVEHIAYQTACKLELPELLDSVGLNQKQISIALGSIISRLIVPGSELRAHRYLTRESALDELMGTELSNLDLQQLYFASDWLLSHKDAIEQGLYLREKELFNLEDVITLFDITNTYFEGHPPHRGAAMGRSKEKRSDCELISLGLLLDVSGFPKRSKILPGNISEPSTLKDMLSMLEGKSGTTVIMDAGIATKDNIEYLQSEGYNYIVVRRDSNLVMPDNDTTIVKDTPRNKVTVSLVNKSETEIELYCHSTAKEAQSRQFTNKIAKRLEAELAKLQTNLKACYLYNNFSEYCNQSTAIILQNNQVLTNKSTEPITAIIKLDSISNIDSEIINSFAADIQLTKLLQSDTQTYKLCSDYTGQTRLYNKLQNKLRLLWQDRVQVSKKNVNREYEKVAVKVGRLKQKYKSVAYTYDIEIVPDSNKHNALAINYQSKDDLIRNKQSGIYCLSSNRKDLKAEELWHTYTVLTEIESAFRSLKSELGMRPIYHQLEHRIDGHIFISILAYHIMHTIRHQLKQDGINNSWDGIRELMAIQIRSTTSLDLQDGKILRVRKTSKATAEQSTMYRTLGINANPCGLSKSYFGASKKDEIN